MRRIATLAALAVPTLLAAGLAAPAAMAADDCPNAAVRAQQQSQHLPNCMAYEKITPDNKGGALPVLTWLGAAENPAVYYALNAGVEDAQGFVVARYRGSRTATGWTSNALSPAMNGERLPTLNDGMGDPLAGTPDLSRTLIDVGYPVNPNDQGIANPRSNVLSRDLYIREPDGSFSWIVPDPSAVDTSGQPVDYVHATSDLDRIAIQTRRSFDPRVTTTSVNHVYVWTPEGTTLATVLPNGDLPTAVDDIFIYLADPKPRTSDDVRRIVFTADSDEGRGVYVRLNADDPERAVTRKVSVGPDGQQCLTPNLAAMPTISRDGTQVIFDCWESLIPGAPQQSFYIRDLDGGPGAVRLLGPRPMVAANADFSRIYTGSTNYGYTLWRDGVAEEVLPAPAVARYSNLGSRVAASVDGEYLLLESPHDFDLPGANVGPQDVSPLKAMQVYLFSARTKEVRCISCRPDGALTDGLGEVSSRIGPNWGDARNPVSTEGVAVFTSETALAPEDTNGVKDSYAWVDGKAVLLSGGRNLEDSTSHGGSPDGSTVYLRTADALVPDDTDGGAYDLYAVRKNGGWLAPEAPTPNCTSNCQAPGPERPSLPSLGSSGNVGRGNLVEETTSPTPRATASLTAAPSVRGKSITVRVKVSRAGAIRVSGTGLRQATVKAKKAGTYRVTVRLSAHGAKQQRSRGRLATRLTARFTPQSGASVSAHKSVTFTATRKGGR